VSASGRTLGVVLVPLVLIALGVAWGWIVAGYVLASGLELAGLALIVFEVRGDLRIAERLLRYRRPRVSIPRARHSVEDAIDEDVLTRKSSSFRARLIRRDRKRATERAFSQIASATARTDAVILDALTEILGGDRYRRLIGPSAAAKKGSGDQDAGGG
jgi:hypothetical protein